MPELENTTNGATAGPMQFQTQDTHKMGRFDVAAKDPLSNVGQNKGQLLQLGNMFMNYQQGKNKQKLIREQLGAKNAKSKLESEYKSKTYKVNDRLLANEIGGNKFQYNEAATELDRREALKNERLIRMERAWNRGEKAPVLRGIENGRPVFLRDVEGNVRMVSREQHEASLGLAGYVDPIENPSFESEDLSPLLGYEEDPKGTKYQSSKSLSQRMQDSSGELEKLSLKRQSLRFAEASRLGLSDPKDIGEFNDGLKKNPTVEDFLKLPTRANFDGMSDNQKDSILRSVEQMGGIQNAIAAAQSVNRMDHAKWLVQFYKRVAVNPNIVYNFSEIDDSYFRDVNKGMRERGYARMTRKSGISKTKIKQNAESMAADKSMASPSAKSPFDEGRTLQEQLAFNERVSNQYPLPSAYLEDAEGTTDPRSEEEIRGEAKRRMSRKKYKRWLNERLAEGNN